ncbi:putative fatty acyl-CoA reductase [Tropilaelaps mercedesae]|uniref:Fatty acyl-CoA reductase n=1 Tax=Tropilaelaps mercedesae TaxID=418985 RepID=A0A1V9XP86_9ACAR|nr:putative fatty acyl-CoA reductase [Tropilaelaps mercedesae]
MVRLSLTNRHQLLSPTRRKGTINMTSNFRGTGRSGEYVGVREFLAGKNLFITGCTGFVGKVLLEKILRSCPDVESVYVLGRAKKGQSLQQRFSDIFNSALFDSVRRDNPLAIEKVKFVEGDLQREGMGISSGNIATLRDCINVVIHSAASVRFDEPLRNAVNMNLYGAKRVLELCGSLSQLEVLVHVSTCYANCDNETVEEKVYPQNYEPEQIMQIVEWLDDESLAAIQSKLLGSKPNTYTFTKSLAEVMIKNYQQAAMFRYEQALNDQRVESDAAGTGDFGDKAALKKPFAVAIVRPSIIVASLAEPVPGWVDNFNGPSGMIVAAACGFLRSVYSKKDLRTDFIPVDIVANTILVAAWHCGVFQPENVMVYNCACGDRAPTFTWADFESSQSSLIEKVTFNNAVRYPKMSMRSSWLLHRASMLFEHWVPAYLADKAFQIVGKKPQFLRLYEKLITMQDALTFFTTHEWRFSTARVERLKLCLSESDRREFNTDLDELRWDVYLQDYVRGLRDFVLKENHKQPSNWFQRLYLIEQVQKAAVTIALYKALGVGDLLASAYETTLSGWI